MRRPRLKSLLEADKFNYLIIYKNKDKENLENILSGDRLVRYQQASRDITRYKLLSGSYFVYKCLKKLGFSETICQQAFSRESSYLIGLSKGKISYSNSVDYHVLTYSSTGDTGVDIEEYRDRPEATYRTFLSLSEECRGDFKQLFYKQWLEKEITFKQKQVNKINYFTFENYLCGYSFDNEKDVKRIQLFDLLSDEVEEITFN